MPLVLMTLSAMTFAVRMVVMVAAGVGVVGQLAPEKRLHRRVGLAFHTPVEANARLRQRLLSHLHQQRHISVSTPCALSTCASAP